MSAPSTTPVASQSNSSAAIVAGGVADIIPSSKTLVEAAKLAMQDDRAIMLDYYADTHNNKAFLGEDAESKDRILVKSKEEFTSLIKKLYKVGEDFIILTENSLYIVSGKIQKRRVSLASLQEAYDSTL